MPALGEKPSAKETPLTTPGGGSAEIVVETLEQHRADYLRGAEEALDAARADEAAALLPLPRDRRVEHKKAQEVLSCAGA